MGVWAGLVTGVIRGCIYWNGHIRRQKNPRVKSGMIIRSSLLRGTDVSKSSMPGKNMNGNSLALRLGFLLLGPIDLDGESLLIIPGRREARLGVFAHVDDILGRQWVESKCLGVLSISREGREGAGSGLVLYHIAPSHIPSVPTGGQSRDSRFMGGLSGDQHQGCVCFLL